MAPTPPPSNAAAKKRYDQVAAALGRVKAKNPALAQRTVQDWVSAGFKINGQVQSDIALISAISGRDATIIRDGMADPGVQALAATGFVSPAMKAIGGAVGSTGTLVGNLPEGTLQATGEGLHQASLMYLGLVLFLITFVVLTISKLLLLRLKKNEGARS